MKIAVSKLLIGLAGLALTVGLSACGALNVYPVYSQRPMGVMSPDLQPGQLPSINPSQTQGFTPGSQVVRGQPVGPTRLGIPPMALPMPPGRDGQIFHNALIDRLAPTGLPQVYAFELINQSFGVRNEGIQNEVSGAGGSLHRLVVSFSFRVNAVQVDGSRTLAFADSLTVSHDYIASNVNSFYVEDVRVDSARRAAITQMADAVAMALQLQFARLNQQANG